MFIGVDPQSTRLAAVAFDGVDTFDVIYKHKMPAGEVERCAEAYRWGYELVQKYENPRVFIETPFIGSFRSATTIGLGRINGALAAAFVNGGADVTLVNNRAWKREVIGSGNAKKSDIMQFVVDNYEQVVVQIRRAPATVRQDIADSACIAVYGHRTAG